MLKPGVVNRRLVGEVIERLEKKGLKIVGLKMVHPIQDSIIQNWDDVEIKKDYFMGIAESKIKCCLQDKHECVKELIKSMIDETSGIVTIICGEDVTSKEGEAIAKYVEEELGLEVEVHMGGQPVYSYLIGVE